MLYDLCFAWNWEYDAEFIALLESACRLYGVSIFQVTPANLEPTLQGLNSGELQFRAFYDRASDNDERFLPLAAFFREREISYINSFKLARRAWDKAFCHYEFIRAGIHTPYTIILPSYVSETEFTPPVDLSPLGSNFDVKPAHGGGGRGVVTGINTWEQVQSARQRYPNDQYLLQKHIVPCVFGEKTAWFRVIYCDGLVFPCWWNTKTHVYAPLTREEEACLDLGAIRKLLVPIAGVAGLDLFSTEIAYTREGLLVVVDYINDPVDLRLQSKVVDGIPDYIVHAVAGQIVRRVRNGKNQEKNGNPS
ncbi:MAG TPA: hypothetical protein PKM21_18420 [Anaerolineales bacterium]|nr:hypothetical protein [Anaerolineales bacterium]